MSSVEDEKSAAEKSEIGNSLDRLKLATLRAIARRERLPQPLFWSLFHTEVEGIKNKRKKKRDALRALFDADWL